MKVKKLGKLRYNIWFYFLLFTVIFVAALWVSQVVLFDYIYQRQKYNSLESIGETTYRKFNTNETVSQSVLNGWIRDTVVMAEDGYLLYLAQYDGAAFTDVQTVYSMALGGASGVADFSPAEIGIITSGVLDYLANNSDYTLKDYVYYSDDENSSRENYYVFTAKVQNQRFGEVYLIISTSLNSLSSTQRVIRIQLAVVSGLLIILSVFLSMYISRKLSDPIIAMSKTAKKWAEGDQNVTFKASGYEELSELADALNYAKEGISKTGRMQADLMANVSHDLKTPLTMIKSYAELIRDISGSDPSRRTSHANVIIDEADRLTMLVNDILDLSKLQNGINELDIHVFDISKLCESVVSRFAEFTKKDGYTLLCEIEPNLYVKADEKKIEQVVYNLITNSINYTGKDKTVKISLKKKGEKVVFETIDSGKGISEDSIKAIWDKYYRNSESHQRFVKGTGLGLSIVKTILESHNLRFGVITKKDVGSNFFVEFSAASYEYE